VPGTESWTSYPFLGLVAAHRLTIVFDAPDTAGADNLVARYCHDASPNLGDVTCMRGAGSRSPTTSRCRAEVY
jgi:hypothetical protein